MIPKYAVLQKVRNDKKTYAITPRIPGGFISPEKLINIANVAKKYGGTIKITSGQRITILGVQGEDVDSIWKELDMDPAVLSPYSIKNVEMCPASFCKRTKQNSLKLGMKLEKRFYGAPCPNRTKIGVGGCMNACGSVNARDIGVLADQEGYIIVVGGSAGFNPRLADRIADKLDEDQAFMMVEAVYDYYNENANIGDKLGDYIDRISIDVFKEGVLDIYNDKLKETSK